MIDLDALQRSCDAATAGPWWTDDVGHDGYGPDGDGLAVIVDTVMTSAPANAALIAAARNALPALIAEVRALLVAVRIINEDREARGLALAAECAHADRLAAWMTLAPHRLKECCSYVATCVCGRDDLLADHAERRQ